MFSAQEINAIGKALEKLRPAVFVKAAPLAIRSAHAQGPLMEGELRRIQGKRASLPLPKRAQSPLVRNP